MHYKYNKLRGRIVEKYGSQRAFADKVKLSYTAMSKKMSGKTGFSQEDILLWMNLLGISKDEIGTYFFT